MSMLENKIAGALYGFAIGDAMGATTEFMSAEQIKMQYGKVVGLLGGGWLNLKPGEVTDDTQMMICVMEALQDSFTEGSGKIEEDVFVEKTGDYFSQWLEKGPKDVGCQCQAGILSYRGSRCLKRISEDRCGNGGLMRALPCALIRQKELQLKQNAITHFNTMCEDCIVQYHEALVAALAGNFQSIINEEKYIRCKPTGYVYNTLNNAIYWNKVSSSFEEVILNAVNDGGDADTIAALSGGIAGALYGYGEIPAMWKTSLDKKIKYFLDEFVGFAVDFVNKSSKVYRWPRQE